MRYALLRLGGRSGFRLRRRCRLRRLAVFLGLCLLPFLLLGGLRLALLLALPPPPPRPARSLRRGEVVGQGVCDLLDRPEPLPRRVARARGTRGVDLREAQQRSADLAGLLQRCVDELRRVLIVPVAERVGECAEESLRLRELAAGPPALH